MVPYQLSCFSCPVRYSTIQRLQCSSGMIVHERRDTCSTDTNFKVAVEKIDDHALIKVMNEGDTIPQ